MTGRTNHGRAGTFHRRSLTQTFFRSGVAVFLITLLFSCTKKQEYPIEPEIGFKYFVVKDTVDKLQNPIKEVHLVFSFTDGDGDIGLSQGDTLFPFDKAGGHYYNLISTYYEKQNGTFNEVAQNSELSNYRIPVLQDLAIKKSIRGDIEVKRDLYFPNSDTIKYDFFIYDRALHKSNTISSPEIILN